MLRTFALGVAEGPVALHAAGIAQREIKPGNVVLSPQGPKIVDFGIAVRIGSECSSDVSASYGTPGWVVPERYSGAAADPFADVFAWGGLVRLAATGHQPFGTGAGGAVRRVREGAYGVDGVPEDLLGPVEAALPVDPGRRPSSDALVRSLFPEPVEGAEGRAAPVRGPPIPCAVCSTITGAVWEQPDTKPAGGPSRRVLSPLPVWAPAASWSATGSGSHRGRGAAAVVSSARRPPGGEPEPSYACGPCQESELLDVSDPLMHHDPAEVRFGPVTLIDFHEQS